MTRLKAVFWSPPHRDKWEGVIAPAVKAGMEVHGDECSVTGGPAGIWKEDADIAFLFGVKNAGLFHSYRAAGIPVIYVDKGYSRKQVDSRRYYRVALNAHQPTEHLQITGARPNMARAARFGWYPMEWRRNGSGVVLAGASAKYHQFHGLPDPQSWASGVVNQIRARTAQPIIYRPKPSWREAKPIPGTKFEPGGDLRSILFRAHCLVTHGSSACFDAVIMGVPSVVLGNGVAAPISSTSIRDVNSPKLAGTEERREWLGRLSFWQWSLDEMRSGAMWDFIRPMLVGGAQVM